MLFKIPRLYDSHTHFLATGEFAAGLNLAELKNPHELRNINTANPNYFRNEWLVGFGWNDASWTEAPNKKILDELYPTTPVFFAKSDGHRSWVNSMALSKLNITSDDGILIEKDHLQAWEALPSFNSIQSKNIILKACSVYNQGGFTHVRDMSCTEDLWNSLVQMSDRQELTLAIEENFTVHEISEIESAIDFCKCAKKSETNLVRMKGIKIFYDGSLGSETAYLSKSYFGKEDGQRGQTLWKIEEVEDVMRRTWFAGLEFSIHCIGDEAAHEVVQAARKISAQGAVGRLNLEHVQVLRPETIQMMKPLHVRCHMQPCHWLSDRVWLKDKLSSLYAYAFPWESLRAAKIPLSFGCDSPIEPPSVWRNKLALEESPKDQIKKFNGDWIQFHSHPDSLFADSFSVIEDGIVSQVVFCGQEILTKKAP